MVILALIFGALLGEQVLFLQDLKHQQAIACGILFLAAFFWIAEWTPLFWVSFFILGLQSFWLTSAMPPGSEVNWLAPFFSPIIVLFLGSFVLSSLLSRYRVDATLANFILRRFGHSSFSLLLAIVGLCAFFSMWMSNTATAAMMIGMLAPSLKEIGDRAFSKALLFAIPFACNLGGLATPIGTPPNAIALSLLESGQGKSLHFLQWMLAMVPIQLVLLTALCWMLLKLYPPDRQFRPASLSEHFTAFRWGARQRVVVGIFLLTVVGWLSSPIHGLSSWQIALLPILFSFGTGLLDKDDFKSLPWDVLFMVGGGLALGEMVQFVRLDDAILSLLGPRMGILPLTLGALVICLVMSSLMSNTATANLILPLLLISSLSSGQQISMVLAAAAMCSCSMVLPISTPPNSIAFSSGLVSGREMIFPGLAISVLSFLVIASIGQLYWRWVVPFFL